MFRLLLALALAVAALGSRESCAQEFRALWADTFHPALNSGTETTALIAAARAAHCNAVVVEVRKRGDAYYRNGLEPVASDVAPGFDPLTDLIQKGHTGSPRIEVHAWIVTYNIWNDEGTLPPQPTHPFRQHPDWVSENYTGAQWDGSNYQLDPGHPAVQQHTFAVAMDILARYNIDGLHFDYVRYSESGSTIGSQPWGYNPTTVARFQRLKNRTDVPPPNDAVWLQWRRDQVTALVRKIYLNAWAMKPQVRISAALIPWGTPPADLSLAAWQNTNAYGRVLQDWRGWMQEGILDLACPMVYRTDDTGFNGWANFAKDRQYGRAAAIGGGWYLNSIADNLEQIQLTRTVSSNNHRAAGVLGYSYAVPNGEGASRSETWQALASGVFAATATPPTMPWKTDLTKGHIMGSLRDPTTQAGLDGTFVTLTGPTNRTLTTDGTGFFGAVDLPPGTYTLTVNQAGYRPITKSVTVTGAAVAQPSLDLQIIPFEITALVRNTTTNTLTVTWNSISGRTYRLEGSNNLQQWSFIASGLRATNSSRTHTWQVPAAWNARAFLRVVEEEQRISP